MNNSGWPGTPAIEGRTLFRLPKEKRGSPNAIGPIAKDKHVFYNPAMAGSRTRTVLLMEAYLNQIGEIGRPFRVLDAMCATGLRARRILHEITEPERIHITATDIDIKSIEWAAATHALYPPLEGKIEWKCADIRRGLDGGYDWIDIDPFGSPVPFLEPLLQRAGRTCVVSVSATDTAALTGAAAKALARRYGARARRDRINHHAGARILVGWLALTAARHDRIIEPILTIVDGHHIRTTVRTRYSPTNAGEVFNSMGWMVANPDGEEMKNSIIPIKNGESNLTPHRVLLPWIYPPTCIDERVSGPLWTGPLWEPEIMLEINEELVISQCGLLPNKIEGIEHKIGDLAPSSQMLEPDSIELLRMEQDGDLVNEAELTSKDVWKYNAALLRSVRGLEGLSAVKEGYLLYSVVDLASHLKLAHPPSPSRLVEWIRNEGGRACLARHPKPAIYADISWKVLVKGASHISNINPK